MQAVSPSFCGIRVAKTTKNNLKASMRRKEIKFGRFRLNQVDQSSDFEKYKAVKN